jgi:hypothetical protein
LSAAGSGRSALDVVVMERSAECSRAGDFAIAPFEAGISGILAKSILARLGLDHVGERQAEFLVVRQDVGNFAGIPALHSMAWRRHPAA